MQEKAKKEGSTCSTCFPFQEGKSDFLLPGCYTQQLKGKQDTLMFKGRALHHPGTKPDNAAALKAWTKTADHHAECVLTMCHPHDINSNLEHAWEALKDWIKNAQNGNSALELTRLLAFDQHMNGLHSLFSQKVIVTDHWFRDHNKLSLSQNHQFDQEDCL